MKNTVYQTKVSASGGRDGKIKSEDGIIELDVRMPNSMGGKGGEFTNPEQLFAGGYAACFDGALNLVARQKRQKINSVVNATVGLQLSETEGANIIVNLDVEINGVEKEVAQELLELAHQTCPYSKAINGNVDVTLQLV